MGRCTRFFTAAFFVGLTEIAVIGLCGNPIRMAPNGILSSIQIKTFGYGVLIFFYSTSKLGQPFASDLSQRFGTTIRER